MIAVVCLALVMGACAPTSAPKPTTSGPGLSAEAKHSVEVDRLIKIAQDRMARQRYLLTVDAYLAALRLRPNPYQASIIHLGLARAYEGSSQRARAIEQLRQMPLVGGQPDAVVQGALLRGQLESKAGMYAQSAAALKVFLASPPRRLSPEEKTQALQMLLDSQLTLGQWGQATGAILDMIAVKGQVPPELDQQLAQVAGKSSSRELEQLLERPRPPAVNVALLLALARAQMREGRPDEAAATLGRARGIESGENIKHQITALSREINQARMVSPGAVGVILPLSGQYALYGRQVLAAVELGLGLFSAGRDMAPTLYIEDSKGDAQSSAAAVTRLVEDRKVMAIIGPMGAATSLAAARQAQIKKVPLITLSRVQGITKAGGYIFQNSLTPDQQVEALLTEAMQMRNKSRFAIVAPSNAYGKGFAQLFAKKAAERRALVVEMENYALNTKDFAPLVKRISGLPPGRYRPGSQESPRPEVKFDALFVPDGPARAAMLIPQLFYYDVNQVLVMGTNLWHNDKLLKQAGRFMHNSIFPVGFNPGSAKPEVKSFVRQFKSALGIMPNLLEAQGHDAALVLKHLLATGQPPRTREAMRQALTQVQGLVGVCGVLSMSPERHLTQSLTIFTVGKNRKFRAVTDQDRLEPVAPAEGAGQTTGQQPPAAPGQQPATTPGQGIAAPAQAGSQTQVPASGQMLDPLPSEPRGPVMPSGTQYPRNSKPLSSR